MKISMMLAINPMAIEVFLPYLLSLTKRKNASTAYCIDEKNRTNKQTQKTMSRISVINLLLWDVSRGLRSM